MRFRRRLLLLSALSVCVSVAAVTWIVSTMTRRAFDRASDDRTSALMQHFQREFKRRGEEVSRRVEAATSSPEATHMAVAAAQASPNYGAFLDDAQVLAAAERLDFLEFADDRGTIISSAHWPAKFGYKEPAALWPVTKSAFLKEEETPDGPALGLFAVRTVVTGDNKLYVIGGVRLDRTFLSNLDLPAGMRVMVYETTGGRKQTFSSAHLITGGDSVQDAGQLAALVQGVEQSGREQSAIIHWTQQGDETLNAFPLSGENNQLLGILLVGSSRQIYNQLRGQIRVAALFAASAGLLLAVVLSSWAAARVTRPVEQLAQAAREIATGNWNTQVNSESHDEIGDLADAFNRMTRDLVEQRERLVQSERVAAWRELARRLAHELKNPLFPLQLTVENLVRARQQGDQQFDETFRESAATLLSEITRLKNTIGRFSEFSKMPQPNFETVRIDEMLQNVVNVYRAQLEQARIGCQVEASSSETIVADPDLLHRALSNLVLNAIDAMPEGGKLTLLARAQGTSVQVMVTDTGTGVSPAESAHLFSPYYTTKEHGTGLGLAIVQSIVSDHGGRISVQSQAGKGTTFIIELPARGDDREAARGTHV
jgi:signal transduction histidine kinase